MVRGLRLPSQDLCVLPRTNLWGVLMLPALIRNSHFVRAPAAMGGPGWKTTAKIAGVPDEYQQLAREEQVKHKRAAERLDRDCLLACQPQIDTPFKSAMDALERLLPFHVRPRRGVPGARRESKNNRSAEGWVRRASCEWGLVLTMDCILATGVLQRQRRRDGAARGEGDAQGGSSQGQAQHPERQKR